MAEGKVQLPRSSQAQQRPPSWRRCHATVVLNGITGSTGLTATLAALEAGRILALANKESLVVGGALVTRAARPEQIVAVDSEHSALAQCLRGGAAAEVDRLILTASGGPFRGMTREQMVDVTPDQALAHPTWNMGRVITTNSATLVNKGLELLEAHLLYGVGLDRIDVVVHPQSIVHSMVQFVDGSTLAQCSPPDMKLPIALGLSWPDRLGGVARGLRLEDGIQLDRLSLWTMWRFPAVELARQAGQLGGTAPAVYNAANEVCVDAFHDGRIGFTQILDIVAAVLEEHTVRIPT
jgi:1-deoxy-D-xylulose-5-phosphate reductoisomerase